VYEFLVLGLIPGTEVRISFGAWIVISAVILVAVKYRRNLRVVAKLGLRLWAKRYHLAAIVALAAISLKRKSSN
jgi:hypothetical protein